MSVLGYISDDAFGNILGIYSKLDSGRRNVPNKHVFSNIRPLSFQFHYYLHQCRQVSARQRKFLTTLRVQYSVLYPRCCHIYRYLAILKPMNLHQIDRRGKIMLSTAWLASVICSAPQVWLGKSYAAYPSLIWHIHNMTLIIYWWSAEHGFSYWTTSQLYLV